MSGCNCERKKRLLKKIKNTGVEKRLVYLDYNGTTPVLPECLGAFEHSCRQRWGNPSSCHPAGARAWEALEESRRTIAAYFKTSPRDLRFCASGSEAIYAGIRGLDFTEGPVRGGRFFITTEGEHSAVLSNILALPESRRGILKIDGDGQADLARLESLLLRHPEAVVIYSPVNHETGARQPVKEIARLARKTGALVFFDAVQCAPRLELQEWRPYCDLFALSAHKLYAPKGAGVLAGPRCGDLRPYRLGGGQEGGFFPGTENAPAAAALAAALTVLGDPGEELRRLTILTGEGWKILSSLPVEIIRESPPEAAPGILCVSLPGAGNIRGLVDFLSLRGICLSRFSACADDEGETSVILTAMGRSRERADRSLRISTGRFSRREDYFALAQGIREYFQTQRRSYSA
jgi:cysteine desulfurase